jgi:hypothetical protein
MTHFTLAASFLVVVELSLFIIAILLASTFDLCYPNPDFVENHGSSTTRITLTVTLLDIVGLSCP